MQGLFRRTLRVAKRGLALLTLCVVLAVPLQPFAAEHDSTPPVTRLSAPVLSTATSAKLRFKVSWSATDESGVRSYDVEYKDGPLGTWRRLRSGTVSLASSLDGVQGHTYYFRARATDNARNVGAWSVPQRTSVPYDNTSKSCVWSSGWATKRASSAFMGSLRSARYRGKSVTFAFKGKAINVIATTGPGRGKAYVYLDGARRSAATISTYGTRTRYRVVVYKKSFTVNKAHKIKIVTRGRVDIDAFAVPALDLTPPTIVAGASSRFLTPNMSVEVSATVKDNLAVSSVKLFYRGQGASAFSSVSMPRTDGKYRATIPTTAVGSAVTPVRYYVEARDTSGNVRRAPTTAPATPYSLKGMSKIVITPAYASLAKGEQVTFSAVGSTDDGVLIPITPTWSVVNTAGSIDASGTFTATTVGTNQVRATSGTFTGYAKIGVYTPAPSVINSAVTWTLSESPYVVSNTDIQSGGSLTIQPGVVVKFVNANSSLRVFGTLNAIGTAGSKITFTSLKNDGAGGDTNADGGATTPSVGDWRNIELGDNCGAVANFDYVAVGYGASGWNPAWRDGAAIDAGMASRLSVKHSTLWNNLYGIRAGYAQTLTLSDTLFSGNTEGCVSITQPPSGMVLGGNTFTVGKNSGVFLEGLMQSNLTLPAEGVYTIPQITVPANMMLRFSPGATVKFLSTGEPDGIAVNGALVASGTATAKVTFTSYKDDTVGGDTNGDGVASSPSTPDWDGLYTSGTGTTRLDYVNISYAGQGDHNEPAAIVAANASDLVVNHTAFASNVTGVDAGYANSLSVSNSAFTDNRDGCVRIVQPPANMKLSGNTFSGPKNNGVEIQGFLQSSLNLPAEGTYIVLGLKVPEGYTLKFAKGSVVKFTLTGSGIDVNGILEAVGDSSNRITFTSYKDDMVGGDTNGDRALSTPGAGDWQFIQTRYNGSTKLDYATVMYGGSLADYAAVYGYGESSLSVKNTLFKSNVHAFGANASKSVWLSGSTFTNNTEGCAHIWYPPAGTYLLGNSYSGPKFAGVYLEGWLEGNLTLPNEGVYTIKSFHVPAGSTLTVKPGATLKFMPLERLYVSGTLLAEGDNDPAGRILFTSLKDDADGDTNGDGAATTPALADWTSIRVDSGGRLKLMYAAVKHAGTWDLSAGAIANNGGSFDVSWCDFVKDMPAITTPSYTSAANAKARNCYWGQATGPSFPGNDTGTNRVAYHFGSDSKLYVDVDIADYRVGPLTDLEKALADIDTFASSSTPGRWTSFTKTALTDDMRATVRDPLHEVDQAKESLCGPAAVVYELALRDPVTYVRMLRQCYELGMFQAKTKWIASGNAALYSQDFSTQEITPADWIIMAIMRDAQNEVFDYNSGDDWQGVTDWGEMQEWITEILWFANTGWNQASVNPVFGWPWTYKSPMDAAYAADRNSRAGGVSFFLVCAGSVEAPATLPVPSIPNHWVVYQGDMVNNGSGATLNVYSWGNIYTLPIPDSVKFSAFMWGVVRGGNVLGVNGE